MQYIKKNIYCMHYVRTNCSPLLQTWLPPPSHSPPRSHRWVCSACTSHHRWHSGWKGNRVLEVMIWTEWMCTKWKEECQSSQQLPHSIVIYHNTLFCDICNTEAFCLEALLPGKPLWKFSQAIHWVEVWAFSISGQRLAVKLYPVYRFNARLIQVAEQRQRATTIILFRARERNATVTCW